MSVLHSTPWSLPPVTVAVKFTVVPALIVAVGGLTATSTAVTSIAAVADLVGSATLVAVAVYEPGTAGAVYVTTLPVPVIVPPLTLHVTSFSRVPETIAVKLCV